MKKISTICLSVLLCLAACLSFPTFAAAEATGGNSVNVGFSVLPGVFDTDATVGMVEFERRLGNKVTLFGRFGQLDYTYDDGTYKEDGNGPGFDVGTRIYLLDRALKGFYLGGALGIWKTDWTYTDTSYSIFSPYFAGTGSSTSLKVEFELGYRFPIANSPVSVMPTFRLGSYINLDSSCSTVSIPSYDCGNDSQIGAYGVFGATVGFQF